MGRLVGIALLVFLLIGVACARRPAPAASLPAPSPPPAPVEVEAAGPKGPPGAPAPAPRPAPTIVQGEAPSPGRPLLEVVGRQVISTASLSVEVTSVPEAVEEVRTIAESLGGFIERLSRSGERATITLRVPQEQFFPALERLEALGRVVDQSIGSEDVTERFIDLEARLKSLQREEQSLLSLLDRAEKVSEILAIERELARVRSEIERVQGQLNFLKRRVDLATITVSLFPPTPKKGEPPSASLTVAVRDVGRSVEAVKALVSSLKGALDQVSISVREGEERATISLRVFRSDFARALASIEEQGRLRRKDLREGTDPGPDGGTASPTEPDAPITVLLVEKEGMVGRAVGFTLGGLALVGLLGGLSALTYRAGVRRGRAHG